MQRKSFESPNSTNTKLESYDPRIVMESSFQKEFDQTLDDHDTELDEGYLYAQSVDQDQTLNES